MRHATRAFSGLFCAVNKISVFKLNSCALQPEGYVAWYRKAAEQGYAAAQCYLGVMYYNGLGVAQSDEEALVLYRKAAAQGNAAAQCNLGVMHEHGRGVTQSDEEAVAWYKGNCY